MRIGELEFRELGGGRPPEVVHWFRTASIDKEVCRTLMFYERDEEGYSVRFIGGRPFDHWDKDLWRLMRYGQEVLNARFKLEIHE